jgi:septal ring factor EnvC (AmiA/AmiB activator)
MTPSIQTVRKLPEIIRLRTVSFGLVLLPLLFFFDVSMAANNSGQNNGKKNIKEYRSKIHRLQRGIIKKEDQIARSREEEQTILSEIESLDGRLNAQADKLRQLEQNMAAQRLEIDRQEQSLQRVNDEKSVVLQHLQKRISSYYTTGNIGFFNVAFSTHTLPELLSFHDAYKSLIRYDQKVIETYKKTIGNIEKIKDSLDLEKTILEEFIVQTQQEKILLEETKIKKNDLLSQVRTEETLHQQAVAEMQRASEELTDSMVAIKNSNGTAENNFKADKGSLPPPVDGVLITLFNQEKTNKLGISKRSSGIELRARDGTDIRAVSSGDVVFSGYLRGYGNTIVIYHGYKYYTVTSRIEKILVEKGRKVKRGQTIGIMGDTATLFDEGLYFEIRQGKTSLDPLLWLNPNKLNAPQDLVNNGKNNRADSVQAKN